MDIWEEAVERGARACAESVTALTRASVPREALAEYVPPRRAFLRTKPATMLPLGEVWRLGALLLDGSGSLYGAGSATRSAERGRPGYQSNSREERREIAAAALRGGYPIGTAVNYGAILLPLAEAARAQDPDSPIGFTDGEIRVRWRPGASLDGAPTLATFLADRVELLTDPPSARADTASFSPPLVSRVANSLHISRHSGGASRRCRHSTMQRHRLTPPPRAASTGVPGSAKQLATQDTSGRPARR
ncbi:hypothetical protein [Leucobacter insecticola]|uniref:hypothetical protein n=1 Tax=Leucobacter insecticola TaxID=2714934 RepID=UPI00197D98E3|nr:hypothetical protein [Leucobacter insecticola]